MLRAAREMFRDRIALGGRGVRLLGVGVSGLAPAGAGQHPLFVDSSQERSRRLARAEDAVRDRMGDDAVKRARLLRREGGDASEEASTLPSVD